jgi:hypothetical protein
MTTRRQFLKVGVAAGTALWMAGAARADAPYRPARGSEPLVALSAADRDVLVGIVPAMLAGTQGTAHVDAVVGSIDRAVAGLPLHLQKEVKQLFGLLAFGPARRWLAGVSAPWPEASPKEVAAFLESWRMSRFALLQQGYQALHELIMASWYARPDAWPAIGYPGPPNV